MFQLNYDSVKLLCNGSSQLMVYGHNSCFWPEILKALRHKDSPFERIFDYSLGMPNNQDPKAVTSIDGRIIQQIQLDQAPSYFRNVARQCKAAICNLVFENFKRQREGLVLIPLLFCVEHEKFIVTPFTPERIAAKDGADNQKATFKELRRCFKLCYLSSEQFNFNEITNVAYKTIVFVRLKKGKDSKYHLLKIKPFWEDKQWIGLWQKRMQSKGKLALQRRKFIEGMKKQRDTLSVPSLLPPFIEEKQYRWESQLLEMVHTYNNPRSKL